MPIPCNTSDPLMTAHLYPPAAVDRQDEPYVYDDGGRAEAGFKGEAGDCVVRAIAIAEQAPYTEIYEAIGVASKQQRLLRERGRSPRDGALSRSNVRKFLAARGWTWHPTMSIGTGCTTHLRADELPKGRIIVALSRHLAAVIDGVVHDNHDPSRDGTRCVYGYWSRE